MLEKFGKLCQLSFDPSTVRLLQTSVETDGVQVTATWSMVGASVHCLKLPVISGAVSQRHLCFRLACVTCACQGQCGPLNMVCN